MIRLELLVFMVVPLFTALPSENSGSYEEIIDTGASIQSTRIEASIGLVDSQTVGQGLTITPHILHHQIISHIYV